MEAATEQSDAILLELDKRTDRLVARRGEEALVSALEAWVHRTLSMVATVQASPFEDPDKFGKRLADLERKHSVSGGLRKLDHALYCMGILRHRLAPPQQAQDPRTAVPAMLEAVWPTTPEDVSLRLELSSLIEADLARAAWELYSLRAWTFSFLLTAHFVDDVDAGNQLAERTQPLLNDRVEGEEVPPDFKKFLEHRRTEYFKVVQKGGPKSEFLLTPVIAGTFAWYCRRTLDLRVRLIGAREFTIAYRRLNAAIAAYRGVPPI